MNNALLRGVCKHDVSCQAKQRSFVLTVLVYSVEFQTEILYFLSCLVVNGDIEPQQLGLTLTHEHMHMKFTHFYKQPPKQLADVFQMGFSLQTVGYLRQYPYSSQCNLLLNDADSKKAVLEDVKAYKKFGGGK